MWVIQVLTQAPPELIGAVPMNRCACAAAAAIMHVYNSTSVAQRRVCSATDRAGIIDIAIEAPTVCANMP